jgi:hypothetical protein
MTNDQEAIEIYIPLLDEGTEVCRPTKGLPLGGLRFMVLPTPDYCPQMEKWEFPPNTIVECKVEERRGREVLVARSKCGIPMIGRGKDMLISYVDDDEHLKDFAEDMP